MELLHIGYFGDSACGKLLTDEIQEYGHQVSFISLERRPIEKFDLIITTENNAETIRRLQQQGKNLLTIVTNKKNISDIDTLQNQEHFSLYFSSAGQTAYLCDALSDMAAGAQLPCCRKSLSTLWSSFRVAAYRTRKTLPTVWRVNTMPNHRRACAS